MRFFAIFNHCVLHTWDIILSLCAISFLTVIKCSIVEKWKDTWFAWTTWASSTPSLWTLLSIVDLNEAKKKEQKARPHCFHATRVGRHKKTPLALLLLQNKWCHKLVLPEAELVKQKTKHIACQHNLFIFRVLCFKDDDHENLDENWRKTAVDRNFYWDFHL